jgi:hypothetical protein
MVYILFLFFDVMFGNIARSWLLSYELVCAFIIVILCLSLYKIVRNLYVLSDHRGLKLFSNTFLFLGIATVSRLLHILIIREYGTRLILEYGLLAKSGLIFHSFFSTLAILYLFATIFTRKFDYDRYLWVISLVSVFIAVFTSSGLRLSFINSSSYLLILHFTLLVVSIIYLLRDYAKLNRIKFLYLAMAFLWVAQTVVLYFNSFYTLRVILNFCIVGILLYVLYKVNGAKK